MSCLLAICEQKLTELVMVAASVMKTNRWESWGMTKRTAGKLRWILVPLAMLIGVVALAPSQAQAKTKVWHTDFVVWVAEQNVGATCRVTFEDGIACNQSKSPNPNKVQYVNLKASGKPYLEGKNQKFPKIDMPDEGRQLYPANRSRWSKNGVSCRLNKKGGVRCSNGSWGFRLNPHSYKTFHIS